MAVEHFQGDMLSLICNGFQHNLACGWKLLWLCLHWMWPIDQSHYSFQKVHCLFHYGLDKQGRWLSSLYLEWLLPLLLFMMWVEKHLALSVLVEHGPGEAVWDSPYKAWYSEAPEPPFLSIWLLLYHHQTQEDWRYPNVPEESTWSVWKWSGSNFLFYIINPRGHRVYFSWEPLWGCPRGLSGRLSAQILAGFGEGVAEAWGQ